MDGPKSNPPSGIGFFGALAICFIVLKLTKSIDWSWWYVLAPLWAPAAVLVVFLIVGALIVMAQPRRKP